jgi:GABA(A) receptor-associated protein
MLKLRDKITDLINTGVNGVSKKNVSFDINQGFNFKKKYTIEERKSESDRVLKKFPDRIPIICEKNKKCSAPEIDKNKYLVPNDLTIGQFIYVIRKRMFLRSEQSLFIFINGKIFGNATMICSIYEQNKDEDGFLYISYANENTFG